MKQNTLGERIKYHRKRCGMTQEQLAERMGVSPQAVSKWENDLSCPDISALPGLADVFSITVDELLGREPPAAEAEPEDDDPHVIILKGNRHDGILFAIYVLCVGLLMAVNYALRLSVGAWTVLWTLALVFLGASAQRKHFSVFGLALSLAGLYFLLRCYFPAIGLEWSAILPLIVILWGISLLTDVLRGKQRDKRHIVVESQGRTPKREEACEDGWLRCAMCFGEGRAAPVTSCLRGGTVECALGNFTVDFSGCRTLAPDCRVKVENAMGKLTLLLPARFAAQLEENNNVTASVDVEGAPDAVPKGILHLSVENACGSVCLRYI